MTTHDLSLAAWQLSEMEAAYTDAFEAMEAKFAGVQAEAAALRRERDAARTEVADLQADRRELNTECTRRAQEAAELRARLNAAYAANDALKQERDAMQKLSAERIAELVSRDLVQRAFEVLGQNGATPTTDAVIDSLVARVARARLLLAEALGA